MVSPMELHGTQLCREVSKGFMGLDGVSWKPVECGLNKVVSFTGNGKLSLSLLRSFV